MNILFIGKRFYTNRDALTERYGRIYQLPLHWSRLGAYVQLWLIDYHSKASSQSQDEKLHTLNSPVKTGRVLKDYLHFKKSKKPDLIIASGDAYIAYLGYRLAQAHGARFIFDVYDKYDEFGGYIKPLGFDLFGFLLKKADNCFFASSHLMRQMGQVGRDHIALNGVDASRFKAIDRELARQQLKLNTEEAFIGYFGSMEPDRGVQDLVDAVTQLRAEGIAIKTLIAGRASEHVNLQTEAVHYLGNLPFDQMPYALASCNLLAIPYRRSPFMDAGASNKIAEAVACRRPIVATRSPNLMANYPKQAQSLTPFMAEPGQAEDLARAIKQQFEHNFIVEDIEGIYWPEIAQASFHFLERLTHDKT
ncbi:glycosyltransferase [Pseudomonas argentinensis]|uniref:glycosyltransferase n=1 Tax=Phytopseudomonas argentinensis TaxID=289370 RepID=UPI0008A876E0|nr:glycosyltransferase [Pseudomonas argentinensis]